ncbi:MAG: hypothetical protein Q8S32_18310 [Burkholderiaceae bacterium]|nr:hypothetical protein [Burkholderiaceae bacterium]
MIKNKVFQAYISAELYDAIKEIADYEKKSVSQIGREMLATLEPGILQARDLMRAAHSINAEARKQMLPALKRHSKRLEKTVKKSLEDIETTVQQAKVDPPQHKLPI